MNIEQVKVQFVECLAAGLENKYNEVKDTLHKDGLYAFTLYCASGFSAFGIAVSTEKLLAVTKDKIKKSEQVLFERMKVDQPKLYSKLSPSTDLYAEMSACEWEVIYSDVAEFNEL
ncbi:hypothetical protein [Leucothrix arctica]|uniref:Uncharacterized protein n=1 Tax=Leucothrix arctica TaxID=1481894 RepID=A0A317CG36_9GAMM|nr:hypothetical protein [Leucothrix arctica]PWQ97525.1 hypothetical protein DKT75_06265 [Leucothrix arctica]